MKLVMTLLVRDEEDIVAANIEYHLRRGVDFVIATDNLSRDGTRGILERYRDKGVLHLILEPEDDYSQHKWVTRMARMAQAEFGADWVINNDADEFWWPESADLKEALRAVPAGVDAALAPRYNFVPSPRTAGANFLETMTVREARSVNALDVPLPPKACHRAFADIEVDQGNHSVRRAGAAVEALAAPLRILHFPLRTYAQFRNKISLGGAAYERNAVLPKEVGNTWRMLYDKLQRGELEDYYKAQELDEGEIARGMAERRLVADVRLRDFARRHGIASAAAG